MITSVFTHGRIVRPPAFPVKRVEGLRQPWRSPQPLEDGSGFDRRDGCLRRRSRLADRPSSGDVEQDQREVRADDGAGDGGDEGEQPGRRVEPEPGAGERARHGCGEADPPACAASSPLTQAR